MATQYSNKPIVTNGLVYALDFGNQKSYVSGSGTAFNLKYSPITSSVTTYGTVSLPSIVNNLARFTKNGNDQGTTINTGLTNHPIVYNGTFTLLYIGQGGPNEAASYLVGAGTSTLPLIAFSKIEFDASSYYTGRSYPVNSNLKFVAVVHSSGSYERYENGLPIPPTGFAGGSYSPGGSTLRISGRSATELFFTGSLGCVLLYNRKLSADEIWQNYQILAPKYGLSVPSKPYTLDPSAYLFLSQSGITDPIITSSINTFVLGLKSASLWDKMVGIYPFVGTGSAGVNLTGSHCWNLKEPSTATYGLTFTGSWIGSTSGSTPSGSNTNITIGQVTPKRTTQNAASSLIDQNNAHISILSYDTPTSSSFLAGTGIDTETAATTLAGDYGTPAAAYSVRKVKTAYSGALMDVRRSIDNVTSSIGYVSNGDLDTGSLSTFVNAVGEFSPGNYSGLAAAYSLRKVSASYSGNAIDVRRSSDNTTGSIGFDANGNLDTGSLTTFVLQQKNILLDSEDFSTAAWQKANALITTASITAPDSTLTGNKWEKTNVGGYTELNSAAIGFSNYFGNTSISVYAKSGSINTFRSYGTSGAGDETIYDLSTGTIISGTGSIESAGNGWYRCSAPANNRSIDLYFTGSVGDYIYIWGAQQTTGSTALLPYVKNTSTFNLTPFHGYVTRWYDQSGNNRHATQSVSTQQPLIVSSGSLITLKGKPSIYFDNVDDAMLTPTLLNRPYAVILVAQQEVSAYTQRIINSPTRNSLIAITRIQETVAAAGDISSVPIGLVNTPYVVSLVNDTTSSQVYSNTVNKTTTFNNDDFGLMNFGASGVYNEPAQAFVSEVIAYTGSIQISSSRTFIENNINNYYSIYTSSNAGYVARWYDQSGNNRHASQTTASSQPLIVLSGSVVSSGTRPSLLWGSDGLTNLGFSRISNIQTVFHISQLLTTTSQSFLLGDTVTFDYHAGTGDPQTWFSSNPPVEIRSSSNNYINGIQRDLDYSSTYYRNLDRNLITLIHTSAIGRANTISQDRAILGRSWRGYIQEITLYTGSQVSNRPAIEYGINNYYNIYPQTSSFTTSSFTIKATPTGITGAINNQPLNGISSTGPVGFITVSRTGSNALTIARNGVTSSFTVPASGALSTGIYLGASNYNGITVGSSPLGISFASVGVGLNDSDVQTLNRQVQLLKYNLQNPSIVTSSLVLNLDALIPSSYPGTGNTWFDLSGNGYNGTLTNGPTFANDNGGVIVLDGSNDYIDCGTSIRSVLHGNAGITFEGWYNLANITTDDGLFTVRASGDGNWFWNIRPGGADFWIGYSTSASTNIVTITNPFTGRLNTWTHIATSFTSGSLVTYINGAAINTTTTVGGTVNITSGAIFTIGNYTSPGNYSMQGKIGSFRTYNRNLSALEVLQNYNATRGRFGV